MIPSTRPLLITFHCGVFFAVYVIFVMSIGRRDVEEQFNLIGPDYIRDMLILLSLSFAGYIGLWNQRRFSLILLPVMGVLLIVFGIRVGSFSLPNALPLIAGLTCLPMWSLFKSP